jgi:hypothetical protein
MSISLLYEQDPGFLSALLVRQSEDYENFAKGIYGLLRQAKEIAEESGDVRYESDNREDGITINLKNSLSPYRANIEMSHIRGNADFVVRNDSRTLKWIGEAKILDDGYSNSHLYEGVKQLATRYSVGGKNEQHGGLLVYNFKKKTAYRMDEWKRYFFEKAQDDEFEELEEVEIEGMDCCDGFFTQHAHHNSGKPYVICHIPFTFVYQPIDKSARQSKKAKS